MGGDLVRCFVVCHLVLQASLNMITRTTAEDLLKHGVYICSVVSVGLVVVSDYSV